MIKNFTRPKGEKPYYYSTTVEDGNVIEHTGDEKYAVYKSEMTEIQRRANLWHKWVEKNYKNAYDSLGVINPQIAYFNEHIREQFMDGEREE